MFQRVIITLFLAITFLFVNLFDAYALGNINDSDSQELGLVIDRTDYPELYLAFPNIRGEAVWLLQARLKELGYDITPDGVYSPTTASIVKLFQVANGLEDTGVVNEKVWKVIMENDSTAAFQTEVQKPLEGRVVIEIETTKLLLTVYQDGKEVVKYPVAVGKPSTPSPLGEWKIVQKSLNWGNGFGTRWLGLNVPWGIYGIHGTNKPGSIGTYASHGCIRMLNRDVEKLYPLIPLGATVRILENGKMFPKNIKPIPLKKGASGQQVVYVQSRLKELGYEFDRADGRFGNMTELAIKYYQA
ncbi:MAG: L,D-transpeptidase family protein, partial [Syntrophomonadaceae bacterium]|nr:L,D-transpeptidase family protein [Syntrophomonadaceae bacterium]